MLGRIFNRKSLKILSAITLTLVLFSSLLATGYAAQQFSISKDNMKNNSVIGAPINSTYSEGSSNISNLSTKKDNPSIGFDSLYGVTDRYTIYKGEVPDLKDYKDNPKMSSSSIDYTTRKWYENPKNISEKLSWDSNKTNDIHALALSDNEPFTNSLTVMITRLVFKFLAALNLIFAVFVKLFIAIGNLDVSIITKLDPIGLTRSISTVVVGDGNTFSPILILATVVFMIGLIGLIAKNMMNGTESARKIIQEALILVLAYVLVGVSINGGYERFLTATTQFSSKAITAINKDLGEKVKLFTYDTGNPGEDANNTMNALTSKCFIDAIIKQQFGVGVNELDLYGENVDTNKLWGIDAGTMKDIVGRVSSEENIAIVSTGSEDNSGAPNLGYLWYAMASGVDTTNPYTVNGDKLTVNTASNDRVLYVIDILSAIDAEAGGSPKTQAIMSHMKDASMGGFLEMGVITLITIATAYSIALLSIMALASKLIFNAGFFFIPFFPIMLLVPKLRDTARKSFNTWVNSAVKMVLSQAMIIIIIFVSSSLCAFTDFSAYMVCFGVLLFFGRFAPILLTKANSMISANRDQLQFARAIDSRMESAANSYGRRSMADSFNSIRSRASSMRDRINENLEYNESKNKHDYSGESSNKLEDTLNNYNNSSEDKLDIKGLKESEEYTNIVSDLASKHEKIDSMSDSEIAKEIGLNIDADELDSLDNKLAGYDNISKKKTAKAEDKIGKFEKRINSPMVKVAGATRLGGAVAEKVWDHKQSSYDNKDKKGHLSHIDSYKRGEAEEKKNRILGEKVTVGGVKMSAKQAIDMAREDMKRSAESSAKKAVRNLVNGEDSGKNIKMPSAKVISEAARSNAVDTAANIVSERTKKVEEQIEKKNELKDNSKIKIDLGKDNEADK